MIARIFLVLLVVAGTSVSVRAQDPAIERLLKKLPPPEKLVKPQITPGVRLPDQIILQDPLSRELNQALASKNASSALDLARKLSARHPKSALGYFLRGSLALGVQQFGEASAAFRKAVSLEPRFAQAHLGLGVAEGAQSRFAAALPHIQRSTQLDPKLLAGWIFQSACCEWLGRKEESAHAARRATSLAPNSAAAWLQLARAENASGRRAEAVLAMRKAARLSPQKRAVPSGVVNKKGADRRKESTGTSVRRRQ